MKRIRQLQIRSLSAQGFVDYHIYAVYYRGSMGIFTLPAELGDSNDDDAC